tara:strand:- start:357 stop:1247 length:891 start_codon:yes stop_codon:yes gene_type:complete
MNEHMRLNFNLPDELVSKIAKYSLPIYRKPSHGIIMTKQYNIIKLQTIKKINNIVRNYCIKDNIKNNKVIRNIPDYDISFLDKLELGELFNNPLRDTKYSDIISTHLTEDKLKLLLNDIKHYMLKKNKYKKASLKKLFLQNKKIYIKKNNVKTISSIMKISKKHCNKTNKPRLLTYYKEYDGTLHLIRYIEYQINDISLELEHENIDMVAENIVMAAENKLSYLFKCCDRLINDNYNKFGIKTTSTIRGGFIKKKYFDEEITQLEKVKKQNKKIYLTYKNKNKYNYQKRNNFIKVR